MRINLNRKKLIIIGVLLLIFIVLPITIYLVNLRQETRSRASEQPQISSVLSISPLTYSTKVEKTFSLNLESNQPNTFDYVKSISFVITYDKQFLEPVEDGFSTSAASMTIEASNFDKDNGKISVTIDNLNIPAFTPLTLGTLNFKAIKDTGGGKTTVLANYSYTSVSNLVYGTTPYPTQSSSVGTGTASADIVIEKESLICSTGQMTFSSCSWNPVSGASGYHYKITNVATGEIVKEEQNLQATEIDFDSEPGVTYQCEVNAVNICGSGPSVRAVGFCPIPTLTITPTPTLTLTPTPILTTTPTLTPTLTLTPVPTLSPTPTLTPAPVPTIFYPTPIPRTPVIVLTSTPVQIITAATPIPTLPATGFTAPLTIGGIVGSVVTVIGVVMLFAL